MLTPTVPHEQGLSVVQPFSDDNPQEQTISSNNPQDTAQEGSIFGTKMPVQQPKTAEKYLIPKSPRWGVTVIRGKQTKIEEFDTSENEADGTAPKK